MALEDFYVHTIETREGEMFPAVPLAVEPDGPPQR
jgi:hypothetical protein